MRRAALAAATLLAVLSLSAEARGNAEAGRQKASEVCATCHGPGGNKPSTADQPIIAGQHYDYLVRSLTDYKLGRRSNLIMKGFAAGLSKRDIEDLSAWFASQPSALRDQR